MILGNYKLVKCANYYMYFLHCLWWKNLLLQERAGYNAHTSKFSNSTLSSSYSADSRLYDKSTNVIPLGNLGQWYKVFIFNIAICSVGGSAKVNVMLFCARFSSLRLVQDNRASSSTTSIMLLDKSRSSLKGQCLTLLVIYDVTFSLKLMMNTICLNTSFRKA